LNSDQVCTPKRKEAAMMINGSRRHDKDVDQRFAELPWDEQTTRWQEIDQSLPAEHLVRQIDEAVEELKLTELYATYSGRGSKALRPDMLLRLVLYERQRGRQSPVQWYRDSRENEPVQWLLFGMKPSRAVLYEFANRISEFLDAWNEQVLRKAQDKGIHIGERVALDGTLVAALASRHRLLNQKTLTDRLEALQQAVSADQGGQMVEICPRWMAKHPETREDQHMRYRVAQTRMDQLQAENAKRTSSKRKKPEKVVVSASEPEAIIGRDKLKVFRPMYNVQLMYDLDSAFITSYEVFAQQNDAGTIGLILERCMELTGRKPLAALADSAYAGGPDLALCEQAGVTLYAPVSKNDFSEAKRRKKKTPQIPKREFTWLAAENTYLCPQGQLLVPEKTTSLDRSNGRSSLQTTYRCPPEHCMECPRRQDCTPAPEKGRSVSRQEHEDLLEILRARMETQEAKELYKLRRQTIELRYADLKEHRKLRRFHGYGMRHARAEIGTSVLSYNLLILHKNLKSVERTARPMRIPEKVLS
jgi:transposase